MKPFVYALSEDSQYFVHWHSVFVAATDGDVDAQRAAYDALCHSYTPPLHDSIVKSEAQLGETGMETAVRFFVPQAAAPAGGWPWVFYVHGGDWVSGSLDSHEFITAALCEDLGMAVVAVGYRQAPEHGFPLAHQDCQAVYGRLRAEATRWGLDPNRVVVAGDGVGGNMAASLTQSCAQQGQAPAGLALIYPLLTTAFDLPSHHTHAHAPLFGLTQLQAAYAGYATAAELNDPRLSPLRLTAAALAAHPPTVIAAAAYDPVLDEGRSYADQLAAAGVAVDYFVGEGLVHGCFRSLRYCADSRALYQQWLAVIKGMLA